MDKVFSQTVGRLKNRSFVVIIIYFIALFLVCSFALSAAVSSDTEEFAVGEISTKTITAPEDVVDEYSTAIRREEAKQKVPPIYSIDDSLREEAERRIESDFDSFEEIRASAKESFDKYYEERGITVTFQPKSVRWTSILTNSEMRAFASRGPEYIDSEDIPLIASLTETEISDMKSLLIGFISEKYREGILEEDIKGVISESEELLSQSGSYDDDEINLAVAVLEHDLRANKIYDTEATDTAKEAAALTVENIVYKKNQNIVRQGESITQAQYELLKKLGFTKDDSSLVLKRVGSFMFFALIYVIAFLYINKNDPDILKDYQVQFCLALLVLLGVLPTLLTRSLDSRIVMAFLPVIIASSILKRRLAFAFAAFLSIVLSVLHANNVEYLFSSEVLRYLIASLAGSYSAMITLRRRQHRSGFLWSGLAAGIATSVVNVIYCMFAGATGTQYTEGFFIGLGSGILCGFLSIGILPVFEVLFSLSTPSRLLELADPGSPLLRRITYEIPGTYHHSIIVANLAEAACSSIGADALLARVAAYYHDLGKLKNPQMFKENQIHAANMHDSLSPEESARIIMSHVSEGVKIARSQKLPKNITDIIEQHHGTSLVYYFYSRAKAEGLEPREEDYRYPGPKPQSREAAVIMMADTAEAAVRANALKDGDEIYSFIDRLIQGKIDDGQFDECDISIKDFILIKEAFVKVFEGANHERVQYPGNARDV